MARIYRDDLMWRHACVGLGTILPWRMLAINTILENVLGEQVFDEFELDTRREQIS